jgi:hypothetical protein
MNRFLRKLVRLVPIGLAIAFVLAGTRTVSAQIACFQNLESCYYRAALRDTWGDRWLAGLDCELQFVDCTRRALIGR